MDFLLRFNKARPFQEDMIKDIYNALKEKKSILINAPTGIGKTDAALASSLRFALENNLRVLFLTPKKSQHNIVVEALNGINEKYNLDIKFVDLISKKELCTNPEANSLESDIFYKACEELIKHKKCIYFNNIKDIDLDKFSKYTSLGHNNFFDVAFKNGLCAYELATNLAKKADVIIADYGHIINTYIMGLFSKRVALDVGSTIAIWDEAHNINEIANEYMKRTLSTNMIKKAKSELLEIKNNIDLSYLEFMLNELSEKKLENKKEALVYNNDIPDTLKENLDEIIEELERAATEYIINKKAKRSYLFHIAKFLSNVLIEDESIIKVITKDRESIKLSIISLYPKDVIDKIKEFYSNVFMSGTLLPLEMYRDLFGIKDAIIKSYSSPFPKENRIVFIDDSATTKFEKRSIEQYKKIAERIDLIKERINGNVAVFFPSFDVEENVFRYIKHSPIIRQKRDMNSKEVEKIISDLYKENNALFLGVMGGLLSEGIDYKNNIIKGLIIVGIPLSTPNIEIEAKINYYEKLFGAGYDYAYIIPAIVKTIQAAGRAIRKEDDKAFIILLDERYEWKKYKQLISQFLDVKDKIAFSSFLNNETSNLTKQT